MSALRRLRQAGIGLALLVLIQLPSSGVAGEAATRPPSEGYLLHCSGCHGQDGRGTPGMTPTLHDMGRLLERPGGREYLARVPGVAQAPVGDEELAALLNWVLSTYSPDDAIVPYSTAEVGSLRQRPIRDTVAARAALGVPAESAPLVP